MQVEYKTEKGTVRFVKVHNKTSKAEIDFLDGFGVGLMCYIGSANNQFIKLNTMGYKFVGFTTDITEEDAKNIVEDKCKGIKSMYLSYVSEEYISYGAKGSFKSIMHHLQIYEANPMKKPNPKDVLLKGDQWKWHTREWQRLESRTGKWVVLFKPEK